MAKNPLDLDWLSQLPTELLELALHAELMASLFSQVSRGDLPLPESRNDRPRAAVGNTGNALSRTNDRARRTDATSSVA